MESNIWKLSKVMLEVKDSTSISLSEKIGEVLGSLFRNSNKNVNYGGSVFFLKSNIIMIIIADLLEISRQRETLGIIQYIDNPDKDIE